MPPAEEDREEEEGRSGRGRAVDEEAPDEEAEEENAANPSPVDEEPGSPFSMSMGGAGEVKLNESEGTASSQIRGSPRVELNKEMVPTPRI